MINTDILIIGAGASGVYSAWRLSKEYGSNARIILIEKCSFLGGRLQSVPFGNQEIYAEVGGMRTFPKMDKILTQVLQQLGIRTVEEPNDKPNNIAFVENERFNYGVFDSPSSNTIERRALISAYGIPKREQNTAVPTIIANAAAQTDPNFVADPASVYEYPELNRTIFVEYLKDKNVSKAAIEVFRDFSGYNFSTDYPIASSVAIREDLTLSGMDSQRFIVDGYNSFVFKMSAEAINANKNFQLMMSTSLTKIKPSGNNFVCSLSNSKGKIKVVAKSVILTVPKNDMVKICAPWSKTTLKAFSNVVTWFGFKAFLKVSRETYNILSHNNKLVGKNISDLPARQIWFYSSKPPCLLVYCDGKDAEYWRQLTQARDNEFCTFPEWHQPDYNPQLTDELIKQISIVFGVCPSVIEIKKILYKFWDNGAYFWKPGNIPMLSQAVKEPLGKDRKVYIVGSDFSLYQGWVEGALETADQVLVQHYGLKPFV